VILLFISKAILTKLIKETSRLGLINGFVWSDFELRFVTSLIRACSLGVSLSTNCVHITKMILANKLQSTNSAFSEVSLLDEHLSGFD
jgi:hypothetical protein